MSALGFLVLVITAGGFFLSWASEGRYTFFEAIYFALITVSTVGYSELRGMHDSNVLRLLTGIMIVAGIGAVAYFQSAMTAVLVEGVLGKAFRRSRMLKRISAMRRHVIVAGSGRTGQVIVEELLLAGREVVVVERDPELVERLNQTLGGKLAYVIGDATEDDTMISAGVHNAAGVIAALTNDRDNVFVALSTRHLSAKVRIVAKATDHQNEAKLRKAGADAVVNPHRIGGFRLLGELVRPHVTEFLDKMMTGSGDSLSFEEAFVPVGSSGANRTLAAMDLEGQTDVFVIAVKTPDGAFLYHPQPDTMLRGGSVLIVLGQPTEIKKLRAILESPESMLPGRLTA